MGFLDKLGKVGNALKTAGSLMQPAKPIPDREYRVIIALDVKATSKRELERAVKLARGKLEGMGYGLVGQLIGIGDEIQLEKVGIEIEKDKKKGTSDGTEEAANQDQGQG